MSILIQNFKILFLIITTGITIYIFLRNYRIGFIYYMLFLIVSAFLGFVRPIFAEQIIIPILIPISIYIYYRHYNVSKISYISLFILAYCILITLISKDASFEGIDTFFIYGLVLLAFSQYIFSGEKNTIHAFALIWLFVFAKTLWLILYGGYSVFQLPDLSSSGGRLIEFETGLNNASAMVRIDPNYFGYTAGIGFLLSFLYLFYRKQLNQHFKYSFLKTRWFLILIQIIGVVELWISLRGLSRGVILAIMAALIAFLFLNRKFKTFVISTILIASLIFVFDDVLNLILLRFSEDSTGSSRFAMWGSIWSLMVSEGRVLFGLGLNYPWWKIWEIGRSYISTHNSWVTILLYVGLLGMCLLVLFFVKSLKNNYRSKTIVGKIRLVMFAYLFVACFSIEPLINSVGWILLAISTSFDNRLPRIVRDE